MSALLFKETYPNYKYSTPEFEKRSGDYVSMYITITDSIV